MDAAVHGNHYGIGRHQEQEETTPSDVSERPSVDDVESDTGSTGALETRSLKDHKGNGASLHVQQKRHWKYLYLIKTLGNILFSVCLNNTKECICARVFLDVFHFYRKVQLLPPRGDCATCTESRPQVQFEL